MVVQLPYPDKSHVFVASNAENEEQADREVRLWAAGHNYQRQRADRTFTIYKPNVRPREWVLLERAANI